MAYPSSTKKRIRQTKKRNLKNRHYKSMMNTWVKKIYEAESKEAALELLPKTVSVIDKVAKKGVIHKNNAANKKSSLTKFVNAM